MRQQSIDYTAKNYILRGYHYALLASLPFEAVLKFWRENPLRMGADIYAGKTLLERRHGDGLALIP